MCDYLKRTVKDKVKIGKNENINGKEILTKRQQDKIDTANRKWEIIQEAKKLYEEKNTKTYIVKKLGITRVTLNIYLSLKEPPIRDTKCIIDDYIPLIKQLIVEGKRSKQIYEILKEAGYKGKMTVLNMHMQSIKSEIRNNTSYLKRSQIKKLLFCQLEEIKNEFLKEMLTVYLNQNEELNIIIKLLNEFKTILLFSKEPKLLDTWIVKVKQINVKELNSFINLIESDIDAVRNAIIYDYSNGLTEGFNNKIKVIKRQMYGRCNFDLLRLKCLA